MKRFRVNNFGPIESADVHFGDLTILVGPQASGKSIFAQLLKLVIDRNYIRKVLEQYNYIWGKELENNLDLFFGEGMSGLWKSTTEIILDNQKITKSVFLPKRGSNESRTSSEKLFYIPAQRILSVADGRPKPFMEFDNTAPFVLRQFSETLRLLLQNGMQKKESIFPISNRLKEPLRNSFDDSIFHGGKVVLDERTGQKKLRMEVEGMNVPFMTWSAGQKEFMPLLLGFYWLCPPSKVSRKDDLEYVILEEPEMGLHPAAIQSVLLQVIDLMSRGYKVIISTHSPVLLEFAWAFNLLKKSSASEDALFELFSLKKNMHTRKLFENLLKEKDVNTYFFSRGKGRVSVQDITQLDPASEDASIADWGGIAQFSTRATDTVFKYINNEKS